MIGLVGPIGSGKTCVARMFGQLGAVVIDADRIAHQVLQTRAVRRALVRAFGPAVLTPDGRVDRTALAQRAFAERRSVRRLNAAVHPPVRRAIRRRIRAARNKVVVVDAPLLQEAGATGDCDVVVYVHAPREKRRKRLRRQRGWAEAQWHRRERWQWSAQRKRATADVVIDNGGPPQRTAAQVRRLWRQFLRDTE